MQKKTTSVCLLGATFNTHNRGVSALAAGTIQCVAEIAPEADVIFLDYAKEPRDFCFETQARRVRVHLVNMRFSKKLFLRNNIAMLLLTALLVKMLPIRAIRERIILGNPCLKAIASSNLIASISGGDSFSDIYGIERFLYVSLPQVLVLLLGQQLLLLPQTLGPFQSEIAKVIARYIVRRAKRVYSRDVFGIRETSTLLPGHPSDPDLQFGFDIGFIMDAVRPSKPPSALLFREVSSSRPIAGLNISGLLYAGGYSRDNMFGLKTDYHKLVQAILKLLVEDKGMRVLLIPHVYGSSEHLESDVVACQHVYEKCPAELKNSMSVVTTSYNQNEIKYVIGRTCFFVGARMHACIAALSQAIPAVALAYSDKFRGVWHSLGVSSLVSDLRNSDQDTVLRTIDAAFQQRFSIEKELRARMPEVKKSILRLFEQELVGQRHEAAL